MTSAVWEYYHDREVAERAAAERATSKRSRSVHLGQAERYAALLKSETQTQLNLPL